MVYLLLLISVSLGSLQSTLLKKYRQAIDDEVLKDSIYFLTTIIVALTYYSIQSGFDLRVNLITAIFSCAYAVVACLVMSVQMRALENTEMVTVSLFSYAGGMLWETVFGMLIFSEKLTIQRIVGLTLVFIAVLIPYLSEGKTETSKKGIFYCLLVFLFSGCSMLVLKLYSQTEGTLSDSVFCFYTNIAMIPFILYLLKKNNTIRNTVNGILSVGKRTLLLVAIAVLGGNIATLLNMYVISQIDMIVNSVLGKALSLITVSLFARLFFGEEITFKKLVCIVLVIAAAAVTVV